MVRKVWAALFVLFLAANTAYLHRVPGLFGDEATEGDIVYQLLHRRRVTVVGVRSYIGPLVDYARVPFVLAFGYTALPLRLLMLSVSVATFFLAAAVFRRLFGAAAAPLAAAAMFFSPTYLLYQRLGWAITLFPFFGFLLMFWLTDRRLALPTRSVLAGLSGGLGLHNYIVFLPTLFAIWGGWLAAKLARRGVTVRDKLREIAAWWPVLLGFWAGFGTQFAVLQLLRDDQGRPLDVLALYGDRLRLLPRALLQVVSGSAYAARYIGEPFLPVVQYAVAGALLVLAALALWRGPRRGAAAVWLVALVIQLFALLVMIEHYTLRYMVVFVLGVWALAGVGLSVVLKRVSWWPVVLAVSLLSWTGSSVLVPYLQMGGSTERYEIGGRMDRSADFVDVRGLVDCVRRIGPVWSDDPHIYNRLLYLSRGDEGIQVPLSIYEAHWLIEHRLPGGRAGVQCQDLAHWRVLKRK